jgi:secondary thiamine-phosphate synthase enzyme
MKIYNEQITLQSEKAREVFNITTRVKAAMEKSGFRDGIILVSSLHPDCAVIVNEEEPGFLESLENWLQEVAPAGGNSPLAAAAESDAASRFQTLLLHHQVVVPFTENRLELGAGQSVLFIELRGVRPRRIVVKVMGE